MRVTGSTRWARQVQSEGVVHAGTRDALSYLIYHAKALQRYCDDGRLPISNIQSEHVARTIAVARKNFLFADTAAGAQFSGRIFSLIETARANGHHPQRYLNLLLTELPNVMDIEQVEALLNRCGLLRIGLLFCLYARPEIRDPAWRIGNLPPRKPE